MTEPQLSLEPPLPDSRLTEFARKYHEFHQANLEPSPFFAALCLYVRDNRITKTQLASILEDHLEMSPFAAKVEATHILNIIQEDNVEILQGLLDGKITVLDARMNSSAKAFRDPRRIGQPFQAASAAPKERLTKAGCAKPFINNGPLPYEEHVARVATEKARWAETAQERAEAKAAALKEQEERLAAAAEWEKARIAKMSPNFRAQYVTAKAKAKKLMAEDRARRGSERQDRLS
jgi:hypothetical protein